MQRVCGNCGGALVDRDSYLYCPNCHSSWTNKALKLVHQYKKEPPTDALVSLVFEPNGTDHNDLVLRLGRWAQRSDSYYYKLDHPANRPSDTVAAIRALLLQWKHAVACARPGVAFYLPYDFSDQCSGWLRGVFENEQVVLIGGWSEKEGWAFYPSDHLDTAQSLEDFDAVEDCEPLAISLTHLLADIDRSLSILEEQAP